MNKVLITTLLLCTGIIAAGCEKTYSVAEFKKDKKLMEEWNAKCGFAGTAKNCENLRLAQLELQKEYEAKAEERQRKAAEDLDKSLKELRDKEHAERVKWRAEFEAKQRAKAEKEAKEKAEQKQGSD
ncbi:EexN family lipoprotein [Bartonella sp. AU55XJBT]|uniref:EexN family lipoprotein n=1 Tax=Bartonella sp. AU55XJBT TaxID=3019091 RepID=UPI00235EE710|nr:EexN family lipoprotein [Bartonella sp. AU55XJBT]